MVGYLVVSMVEMKGRCLVVCLVATSAVLSVLLLVDEKVVYLVATMDMMLGKLLVVWTVGLLERRRAGSMADLLEILMGLMLGYMKVAK